MAVSRRGKILAMALLGALLWAAGPRAEEDSVAEGASAGMLQAFHMEERTLIIDDRAFRLADGARIIDLRGRNRRRLDLPDLLKISQGQPLVRFRFVTAFPHPPTIVELELVDEAVLPNRRRR